MTVNNITDFLSHNTRNFTGAEFNFELELNPNYIGNFLEIKFTDCVFKHKVYFHHITSIELDIIFINCKFLSDIDISLNHIRNLSIIWHLHNNSRDNCNLNSLFEGSIINISSNQFDGTFKIKGLNHHKGKFCFIGNIFTKEPSEIHSKRKIDYSICEINNNYILNGSFNNNTLYMPFEFKGNELKFDNKYSGHTFKNNLFHKAFFENTDFGGDISFHDSKFYSTTLFTDCESLDKTSLIFSSCEFKGFTLFDRSIFNYLEIKHSMFEKKTSFDVLEINRIKLHQVTFLQGAFFDDIKINKIENKEYLKEETRDWRGTLRLIKQEFSKAENKIDSNRFRNYELAVHYKDIKFRNEPVDTTILWATKWSTNFGSWIWALCFTLIAALFFYSLFFVLEDYDQGTEFCMSKYITGYFRFLIVTDFYNPLSDGRQYIANDGCNHIFSWLLFIIGKIVIAFGIYEMIQAFRKFKA